LRAVSILLAASASIALAACSRSVDEAHAPGRYRTYAPLQHLDAFYEAFAIEEGDPMWLAPKKRVTVW
jgi:predicted metalloendopeptidase